MGVSALTTAIVEYVADQLNANRDRELDRVLRYHGAQGLPEDCVSENGTLSINVVNEYLTDAFPVQAGARSGVGASRPAIEVHVRFFMCWPQTKIDGKLVEVDDDEWDARSADLQEVADIGTRALLRVMEPKGDVAAILAETGCRKFRFVDCRPTGPRGFAAGWVWRCYAAVSTPTPATP